MLKYLLLAVLALPMTAEARDNNSRPERRQTEKTYDRHGRLLNKREFLPNGDFRDYDRSGRTQGRGHFNRDTGDLKYHGRDGRLEWQQRR